MRKFNSLSISNIKGIGNKTFKLDLWPNKPCILVAPNGFGKSSIACAFNSLATRKITLNDDGYHDGDQSLIPELKVEFDEEIYTASTSSNDISENFDCFVINSPIIAKVKRNNFTGIQTASASIEVDAIELISTIPKSVKFEYSLKDIRNWFGKNGKILEDIRPILLKNSEFLYLFKKKINQRDFSKNAYLNSLRKVLDKINNLGGTSKEIKETISNSLLTELSNIQALNELCGLIQLTTEDPVDCYLHGIQLAEITKLPTFKEALEYSLYQREKSLFDELLSMANTTRYPLTAKEVKKSKSSDKKKLIIEFPKANSISNGQRDILSFISQIQKAKRKFKKDNCILIVDEIFDYLDDANLVSFQFYITKLIEEFKNQGRNIYPILLTHLDPFYFNHFCFNKHKMQVCYLARDSNEIKSKFLEIVRKREKLNIKDDLDKHFFHYHPDNKDIESYFSELKITAAWGKSHSFYQEVFKEKENYIRCQKFDPIAVLFAVRIKIEQLAYERLDSQEDKSGFIEAHTTKKKLIYCEEHGVTIPETHYLLGLIYNNNLHWKENTDLITPLMSKLENMTIRKMISEIK